jgi:transcriptional regulator with XRE-family HTH domain
MNRTFDSYRIELGTYLSGFAANVRRLRTAPGTELSQEQLAERARLHRTEIGKIEQASVEPRLTTLVILADALGVTLNDLVEDLPVPGERKPAAHRQQFRG